MKLNVIIVMDVIAVKDFLLSSPDSPIVENHFFNTNMLEELMDFMNKNIVYGWIDNENNRHINTLRGFRENYQISSIEEILSTGLGTCIEQAKLIKFFFDKFEIENKLYCYREYETEENFGKIVKMHCFILAHFNEKWYHFEHSSERNRGIYVYDDIESAIIDITNKFNDQNIYHSMNLISI